MNEVFNFYKTSHKKCTIISESYTATSLYLIQGHTIEYVQSSPYLIKETSIFCTAL